MENQNYPKLKNAILLCLLMMGIQIGAGLIIGVAIHFLGFETGSLLEGIGLILIFLLSFGLAIFIGFKKTRKKFNDVFMFNNVSLNLWIPVIVFMFGFVILSSELNNRLVRQPH